MRRLWTSSRQTKSQCLKSSDESSDCEESDSESGDIDFLQSLRLTVVDMMSSLQGYLQTFFGGSVVKNGSTNADGSEETILVDDHLTASLMGLAVMVMVVIAMRRG
ncbi:unnamed protein product [Ilex paraguariensis]|uniref:Uncharacterized protein n=1 Tax=Ilex paraguariensis TaxID=185542 RepID=A0ABC8R4W3_9AQUA